MYPSTSLQKKTQINAAVAEVLKEFSPWVKYIRPDVGHDWTGEWALFFRVMLSDEAARNRFGDLATRVMLRTTDHLDIPNLGMFPYFDFRSESEQAMPHDPAWDPLPS
jgi:hypothetical protein